LYFSHLNTVILEECFSSNSPTALFSSALPYQLWFSQARSLLDDGMVEDRISRKIGREKEIEKFFT
jgi:hypothetical protein